MTIRIVGAGFLLVTLIIAGPTAAQTGDGSLRGYIKDNQGGVLPGVTVTATSPALLKSNVGVTDNAGYYRLLNLPPGTYTVTADLAGFAVFKREGILLRAGSTYAVDITMQLGTLAETVTVSGASPMIEVSKPGNVLNIDGEFQRQMPLQPRRLWSDFLELTPGVNSRPFDDGSGRMVYFGHGTELFAHAVQLEGMIASSYNDPQMANINFGTDMIQDTQVKTGGVDASSPLATGMVINVITKSGGNQFRGSGAAEYEPYSWNGNNAKKADAGNFAGTPTISRVNQLDAALGGPIKNDRVWFFGSVRYSDLGAGISRTPREVATLEAFFPDVHLFENYTRGWQPFIKTTARLGNNHEFMALYQGDRIRNTSNREYNYEPIAIGSQGGGLYGSTFRSVWGNNVTTTFVASYNNKSGSNKDTFENQQFSGPQINIHQSAFAQAGRVVGTGLLLEGGNVQSINLRPASLITLRGDLTWFKKGWGGSHEFQTGFFAAPRSRADRVAEYVNDGFIFEERRQIDPNNPSAGTVPFHRQYVSPLNVQGTAARDHDLGVYVQDSWKPTSRLTANVGVRVDFIRRFDNLFKVVRQSSTAVGPRAGFVYLLTEDAKNVLRGSFSRVHEQVTARDAPSSFGPTNRASFRDEYDLDGDGQFESVISTPAVTASLSGFEFAPNIHAPWVDEFILGLRKQFPGQISVDVAVVKRAFKDTYALVDINGFYPDGPFEPFKGFGRVDPNRGLLYQQTNNSWSRQNYTGIEATVAKNLSNSFQFLVGLNRQWQHISGTWNPTDPARFIQPDAFPNDKLIYTTRGNNEENGLATTTALTYGTPWQQYSIRLGGTWFAPWGLVVASSYTIMAGSWSGAIIDRLPANDPQLAIFGPPTVTLENGTTQPNPLATRIRFVYKTRGDGQVLSPAIRTLGLKVGKTLSLGGPRELELAANVFNLLNSDDFNQYTYSGANQVYNPNYLQLRNQQPARSLQVTLMFRY